MTPENRLQIPNNLLLICHHQDKTFQDACVHGHVICDAAKLRGQVGKNVPGLLNKFTESKIMFQKVRIKIVNLFFVNNYFIGIYLHFLSDEFIHT